MGLRPYLSDKVPHMRMEALKKIKKRTNVRFTIPTVEWNCSTIFGNAGRYMSVVKGGKALRNII